MRNTFRRDEGATTVLVVFAIACVIVILAYAAASRQAGVWRQQTVSAGRDAALDAARSGADLALATAEAGAAGRMPVKGTLGEAAFEVTIRADTIVSKGIRRVAGRDIEVVVTVRFEKTAGGLSVVSWREE
jgi:type II secretory pathway pseudopilin PulG